MFEKTRIVIEFVVFLCIGFLVFLFMDNAIAGAAFPALRASWKSFQAGVWVARSDQNRPRALVCAAFFVATGFWKAGLAALVAVFIFVTAFHIGGKPPNMNQFAATMTVFTGGLIFTVVVGLAASVAAFVLRIRVWCNPRLRQMAQGDLNNLADLSDCLAFNYAIFVLGTSVAAPILVVCGFLIVDFRFKQFTWMVLIIGPVLAILLYGMMAQRMIASDAAECWR